MTTFGLLSCEKNHLQQIMLATLPTYTSLSCFVNSGLTGLTGFTGVGEKMWLCAFT